MEYGAYPHEQGVIDTLWERSPLRYANKVKTPTLFLHGENDNDVPITEAEQFYIALKDVGVETVLVRYPREGHGLRETRHVVDALERSIVWYEKVHARRSEETLTRVAVLRRAGAAPSDSRAGTPRGSRSPGR